MAGFTSSGIRSILTDFFTAACPVGVVSVYLFGSTRADRTHRESDVDVGLLVRHSDAPTARERFEVRLRLIGELTRVLSGREVDLVVLNDCPPRFARRIVIEGDRIYCADPDLDHVFRRDVQLRAADLEPFLRRMERIKLEAIAR